jgi:hypothetical protein
MSDVENWSECSELNQDPRYQDHDKAGHTRIRRLAFIAPQTSGFDCGFHDRTSDLSTRKLRALAAADVQISA